MSHATLRRLSACLAIAALLLFVAVLANTLGRGEREETELASGHWFERIARRPFSEVDYARGQLDYDLRDLHREMAVRSKIQAFDLLLNTQEFWYDLDSSGTTLPNEWIALRRLLREGYSLTSSKGRVRLGAYMACAAYWLPIKMSFGRDSVRMRKINRLY